MSDFSEPHRKSVFPRDMAIIVVLLLQTFTAVWWASGLSSTVTAMDEVVARHETILDSRASWPVAIARLEVRSDSIQSSVQQNQAALRRIEDWLRQETPQSRPNN